MPTFCRKPEVASSYSSLKQPYTKMCHRQTNKQIDRHTDEINNVRFRRYVCNKLRYFFLLRKKNIQLSLITPVYTFLLTIALHTYAYVFAVGVISS